MLPHSASRRNKKCRRGLRAATVRLRHPARTSLRTICHSSSWLWCADGHDRQRSFLRLSKRRSTVEIRWRNADEHEVRVAPRPAQGLLLRFEKAIDHDGVAFDCIPPQTSRRLAAPHRRTGIDRHECAVRQDNFAAVGNPPRIDRAVAEMQARARRTNMPLRPAIRSFTAAGPIDSHPREDRLLGGTACWREEQQQQNCGQDFFHH
jgi:hypothetical protein